MPDKKEKNNRDESPARREKIPKWILKKSIFIRDYKNRKVLCFPCSVCKHYQPTICFYDERSDEIVCQPCNLKHYVFTDRHTILQVGLFEKPNTKS